ncbi:hypothetical protein BGZ94_001218 [Podila epigama]|nr:hypothetical protein BGZ94_001218 [Podila epigama]
MRFDLTEKQTGERMVDALALCYSSLRASWLPFTSRPTSDISFTRPFKELLGLDQGVALDNALENAQAALEALLHLKVTSMASFLENKQRAVSTTSTTTTMTTTTTTTTTTATATKGLSPSPISLTAKVRAELEQATGEVQRRVRNFSLDSPAQAYAPDSPTFGQRPMTAQKRPGPSGRSPPPSWVTRNRNEKDTSENATENVSSENSPGSNPTSPPSTPGIRGPNRRSVLHRHPYFQHISTDLKDLAPPPPSPLQNNRQTPRENENATSPESSNNAQSRYKKASTETLCDSAVEMSSNSSLPTASAMMTIMKTPPEQFLDRENEEKKRQQVLDAVIRNTRAAIQALQSYRMTVVKHSSSMPSLLSAVDSRIEAETATVDSTSDRVAQKTIEMHSSMPALSTVTAKATEATEATEVTATTETTVNPIADNKQTPSNNVNDATLEERTTRQINVVFSSKKERELDSADCNNGYESDSALFDRPSRLQLSRRGNNRRVMADIRAPGRKVDVIEGWGTKDMIQLEKNEESLPLGPGVEVTHHDEEALAVVRQHMARMERHQRHIHRPSVTSLHSIMADTHSVVGPPMASKGLNATAESGAAPRRNTDEKHRRQSMMVVFDAKEEDERSRDDIEDGDDDSKELGSGTRSKPTREYGFMDFLREPLDREQEEREIQHVEREIIQSDITARFLTANLANLYPSSSRANIPAAILPTARNIMFRSGKMSHDSNAEPKPTLLPPASVDARDISDESTPGARVRPELQLVPQAQIQIPNDHRESDDCKCSYCVEVVKPSQVPVLSRAEYELAELQSQCDAKDQHVSELLTTVQSLQGQVNVLNAKLVFLHDHHTTRPMRRRTLARHSTPVHTQVPPPQQTQQHQQPPMGSVASSGSWQSSLPPLAEDRGRHRTSAENRTESSLTSSTISSKHSSNSFLGMFAEGIQIANNADSKHLTRQTGGFLGDEPLHHQQQRQENQQYLFGNGHDMIKGLGDDDTMSYLDLDEQQQHQHHRNMTTMMTTTTMTTMMMTSQLPLVQSGRRGSIPDMSYSSSNSSNSISSRQGRYGTELERVLREMEEMEEEEEPEREGEDLLDAYYYMDAYKTMDQQLYRRPILPMTAPPRPMSTDQYRKHHRLSLPLQTLMSKKISIRNSFRWKGRAAGVVA